ncbi:MAG TPA: hypothetical protein VKB50_17410 [Vicinamibacterales bacterium]|nr:hypothetical protein [Vicinamibacterales bacterium]
MGIRLVLASLLAAAVVFLAVQDREMGVGAGQYVAAQRAALAGRGPAVSVDEVMAPAVRHSVRLGLIWGGLVGAVGLAGTAVVIRRSRRG